MSTLRLIHALLREEYAVSRHVWWRDEASGKLVNDVIYTLKLVYAAAECFRRGEEDCWRELVAYCIERSMSYEVMVAIGEYLAPFAEFDPLPLVDCSSRPYRNWRGGIVPLLDETDQPSIKSLGLRPEPDREMTFKGEHQWSLREWRTRDEHPAPTVQNTASKSIHWLF